MNHAAMLLFQKESTPGSSYYGNNTIQNELSYLSKELESFLLDNKERICCEKQIETVEGLRFFQVNIEKMLDISEKFSGIIIMFNDITEKKTAENILQQYASIDFLTKIYNRRHFSALAELEIMRANRYHHPLSLLMIDADKFKKVNDTYGHDVGDIALKLLASIGKSVLRNVDIFGRIGGEEFTVLLPETDFSGAREVAERLRHSIEETEIPIEQGSFNITVSIGLVTFKGKIPNLQSILKKSDELMYLAKKNGRNRIESYLDEDDGTR